MAEKVYDNLFSLPPVLTVKVWNAYFQGKQNYITAQQKAGQEANSTIAMYSGALHLIREGLVHVAKEAPEQLSHWLPVNGTVIDVEATPLTVVGYVNMEVASKIETAFFGTLPWEMKAEATSTKKSSPIS